MKLCRICLVLSILVASAGPLLAADNDLSVLPKIVAESAERFEKAAAARDAKAIGALFTKEAEYIDADGIVFHGRDAIEAEFAAILAVSPEGTTDIDIISIRPVAAGVMTAEGVSTFTAKDQGQSSRTRYTATHVKQADGKWLMASVRELSAPALTAHDRLKDLAWLSGKWLEESDGSSIRSEWSWSEDGNYLLSKFEVHAPDGTDLSGTHRVGWDPEREQFRSWVFESEGGFGEGHWTVEADASWSLHLSGVGADGVRLSMRMNYARSGADALVVSQSLRSKGGAALPDVSRRLVRLPPEPDKKPVAKK